MNPAAARPPRRAQTASPAGAPRPQDLCCASGRGPAVVATHLAEAIAAGWQSHHCPAALTRITTQGACWGCGLHWPSKSGAARCQVGARALHHPASGCLVPEAAGEPARRTTVGEPFHPSATPGCGCAWHRSATTGGAAANQAPFQRTHPSADQRLGWASSAARSTPIQPPAGREQEQGSPSRP